MRKLLAATSILALTAGVALAQTTTTPATPSATITLATDENKSTVTQGANASNNDAVVLQQLGAPGSSNASEITQLGDTSLVDVSQDGDGSNLSSVTQDLNVENSIALVSQGSTAGFGSSAPIAQGDGSYTRGNPGSGGALTSEIYQNGEENIAAIDQTGAGTSNSVIDQSGTGGFAGNLALVTQTADDGSSMNASEVVQKGTGLPDGGNDAIVSQETIGANALNESYINQTTSGTTGHTATVTQTATAGVTNRSDVMQSGNNNSANVTQN